MYIEVEAYIFHIYGELTNSYIRNTTQFVYTESYVLRIYEDLVVHTYRTKPPPPERPARVLQVSCIQEGSHLGWGCSGTGWS